MDAPITWKALLTPWRRLLSEREFVVLLLSNLLLGMAYSFVVPFYSMFGTIEVGMSNWVFGVFMTITSLSGIAITTVLARWSDTRFSRRSILLLGCVCGVAGYASYAYVRDVVALTVIGSVALGISSISFAQLFAAAREAIATADFGLAERLLGRPYCISGRVLHGQKLGRQLGAPTANVQLKRRKAPLNGVFLVSALVDGRRHAGVANIGVRPSVAGDGSAHLEVHLLDFAGDLYGRRMTVAFRRKLRDEQRFASLEALKTAIAADIAAARAYWLGQPLQ